jgi:hypothetical protein
MSFLGTPLPWFLTKAAYGGLKSFPAQRFRGALPHLFYSMAVLMRFHRMSSPSWRTNVGNSFITHSFNGSTQSEINAVFVFTKVIIESIGTITECFPVTMPDISSNGCVSCLICAVAHNVSVSSNTVIFTSFIWASNISKL